MKTIVYYVSGHGFGHARRAAEVIRSLISIRNDVRVLVRSAAPGQMFADLGPRVHFQNCPIDRGAIEIDPLRIDWSATLDAAAQLVRQRPQIVRDEQTLIGREKAELIVADVPFLPGDIAEAAGVPCVGIGNFTWDWVYEPHAALSSRWDGLIEEIRSSYRKMGIFLRVPFSCEMPHFGKVIDVPIIARTSQLSLYEVLSRIGIANTDRRPRVLVAMRGGLNPETLAQAARSAPAYLFIWPGTLEYSGIRPDNLLVADLENGLNFTDLLSVSQAVIAKLGHGIVSDCCAARCPLLWPARTGFREDPLVIGQAKAYFRTLEIEVPDFTAGRWAEPLERLWRLPKPTGQIPSTGAATCANYLAHCL